MGRVKEVNEHEYVYTVRTAKNQASARNDFEGGEEMTMIEIVELLKNILEVLDKLYHATIGEENDNAADSE